MRKSLFMASAAIVVMASMVEAAPSPVQPSPQITQQQFSVARNRPQQFKVSVAAAGQMVIDLSFRGVPVTVTVRNAAGQIVGTSAVRPPNGRLVYNIPAALLRSGNAFNVMLVSSGNAAGVVRVTTPAAAAASAAGQQRPGAAAPVKVQPAAYPMQNLTPVANWETRIRKDKVRIAEGMEFRVKDYIRGTSFRNDMALKKAFDPAFQSRMLKRPMQYTEDVQDLGDRLYVKRTMLLDAKDPCAPELEQAGISICFKPTGRAIRPESKQYLAQIRAKIQQRINAAPNDPESVRVKPFLQMTDAQLLDQILNKDDTTKIISHESVVPYVAYQFKKVPAMEMFDFRRPIPRLNQLTSIQQTAIAGRTGFTAGASAAGGGMALAQQGAANINQSALSQAQGNTNTPTTYTFPTTKEMTAKALTGWTIGKTFGDRFEVTFAKERWWHDRYYASFNYNITAGFGLRWPFEIKAKSTIDKVYGISNQRILDYPANQICQGNFDRTNSQNAYLCAQRATVNVQATPVDGDPAFYAGTGLPGDKIFKGKEFVFEIGATCKFYASIPGPNISYSCPSSMRGFDFSKDFTPQLGNTPKQLFNFTVAGRPIGLALEMGIGYAALNPGVSLMAHSGRLNLGVEGYQAAPSTTSISVDNVPRTFTVSERNAAGNWGVDLYNPQYNVSATLTPSLQVQVGIDLGVYEWSKKFGPYNIDALGIELGSVNFPTHSGTRANFEMHNIGTRPTR
ncbi:MAG TPA: hypothetical protein PL053_05100 [Deltaproteobacteria bacterium]|nr:hypothetical protein [Deltaproteobacteria bacterium]